MDDHKVKAILDWEPFRSVPALKSFLGLASYYHKFINNFAKIATPLTNFLKKSFGTYEWDEACNEAFETLKGILMKAHVLKLPDFDKDFEIHSNAFDFAIRRVLVQNGRLVAFESKKLSETKQRWPTHEKEMWAMIHCLKTWGHYISSKDVVWTDNVTLKYFATQLNHILSPSSKLTSRRDLSTKSLYRLCAFSRLALAISHKCRLSSSSYVTIGTSSLPSFGGCPCAAKVVGSIGDLPITI